MQIKLGGSPREHSSIDIDLHCYIHNRSLNPDTTLVQLSFLFRFNKRTRVTFWNFFHFAHQRRSPTVFSTASMLLLSSSRKEYLMN
ncbi:hypothetical protein MtrunA17_Chr6g0473541 [Medicago truncatula]|uniref:Uncharacterized protein n=1 Tax=Medicago truncatula TaxID=3880 RepID=A0A396HGX8_MEDTR|nr:hypothetical protein MtrunA17_Chr6g0473541 [Medicago truncatula]